MLSLFLEDYFIETILLLAGIYIVYLMLSNQLAWQNRWLLLFGYLVYGLFNWKYLYLLLFISIVTYYAGKWIAKFSERKTALLWAGIIINIGFLALFKYADVFIKSLSRILTPGEAITLDVVLPLGISFYTLQAVQYLVEIHNGRIKPSDNFVHLGLYLSFIFKLPAGPIERPQAFFSQIENKRSITGDGLSSGLFMIILGLLEKKVMADNLAILIKPVFDNPAEHAGMSIPLATVAFAFQLYGDFAGYSHMARGYAKLFGFNLVVNFKLPYFAGSPNEFWMRWHISLSNWLRDMIFFPTRRWLVQRKAPYWIGVALPIFATMLLSGVWHGSSWNFILWGGYHALLSILYHYFDKPRQAGRGRISTYGFSILRVGIMFTLITAGWLIFRAESLTHLKLLVSQISLARTPETYALLADCVFFISPIIVINLMQAYRQDLLFITKWPWSLRAISYALLIVWIMIFSVTGHVEFIYAQF